jgi:hypothetical protein
METPIIVGYARKTFSNLHSVIKLPSDNEYLVFSHEHSFELTTFYSIKVTHNEKGKGGFKVLEIILCKCVVLLVIAMLGYSPQ